MLNPNRPIALLPQDRQIMQLTGMSEKDYRFFMRQAILHSKLRPGEPTAFFDPVSFIITLVIGIALSYVATLLAPKPRQQEQQNLDTRTVQGQNLVNGARYTPKTGFDSVQNVVELGSTIPLVYAKRQIINGIGYGGVRINTNLVWSQLYSIGGGQLLRAVFLVGEGTISNLDAEQFAIGNNLINGYDLNSDYGRITIYSSPDGGRLVSSDRIAGQLAAYDEGNAENEGGSDVFQVRGVNNEWKSDFCYVSNPSNQTTFGLYGFIGSNFPFRLNPIFRSAKRVEPNDANEIVCEPDDQQKAERLKQDYVFPGRVGVIVNSGESEGIVNVSAEQTVRIKILSSTDALRTFNSGSDGEASCGDVAQSVASRQRSNDEQINVGDVYRIGSALCICTSRSPQTFVSDADNEPVGQGTSTEATFVVLRGGAMYKWNESSLVTEGGVNATEASHIMQSAEATFSTERQGQIVEVGIRSNMQIRIQGLCNFKDARGYNRIDFDSCDKDAGKKVDKANLLNFSSGVYSTFETRYSFFRVSYRVAGSNVDYTPIQQLFGIRSTTGVAVYNYLRFQFPSISRWEMRLTPVSGWEVRYGAASGTLEILDPHVGNEQTVSSSGVEISYNGETVSRTESTFAIQSLTPIEETITSLDNSTIIPGKGYQTGQTLNPPVLSTTYNVILDAVTGPGRNANATITVVVPLIQDPLNPQGPQIPDPLGGSVTNCVLNSGGSLFSQGDVLKIRDQSRVQNAAGTFLVNPSIAPAPAVPPINPPFRIDVGTTAKQDLGTGFDDGTYYADAWARLAESFIYNEITATTSQPEHQVSYINTITANKIAPTYNNLAIVGMNIRSSKEINTLDQFSVYVNEGIKATSNFSEVLYDLLTNDRYGTGQILSSYQIDEESFTYAKSWTYGRKYFFDGAVSDKINIRTWAAEIANNYLLDFLVRNGRFALAPVANFEGPEDVSQLFTAGNILEDSFQLSVFDEQERISPRISVVWREERESSSIITKGLFPVLREVTVREIDVPIDAPLEKIDVSDYVTSERHAIDLAKWKCLSRRLVTNTVTFKTTPTEAALDIGSVFKLGMETISYNQPQNGAISDNGTVTAWPPIDDGKYSVLLWDGKTDAIQELKLTIKDSKCNLRSAVFCLKNSISNVQTYKTQSLSYDEDGNIDVVATYFPTIDNGYSEIVAKFDDSNFLIEGRLS